MSRPYAPAKPACPYCGGKHDRVKEDAACGCGCGDEPMGCGPCMADGGPPRRFDSKGYRLEPGRSWREEMFDE